MTAMRVARLIHRALTAVVLVAGVAACRRGTREPDVTPKEVPIPPVNSVAGVVQAMRDRYANNWYKSLSFTQVNRYTLGGKEQKSEWVVNLLVPGKVRIDFVPLSEKSGLLIDNNRITTFVSGKRIESRRQLQPRPFLTSDVYVMPVNVTVRRLDSLGVDTTRLRLDRLEGKRVFVLGAELADKTSTQVWIDAETLLLTRFIQSETRAGKKITSDMRVTGYIDIAGFPVPEAFVNIRDGMTSREDYTNVKVNAPMPAALFDPARWSVVRISQ